MPQRRWSSPNPVEPGAGRWRMSCPPEPRRFRVPPPPLDDSEETRDELRELRTMTHNRSAADIQEILRWSVQEPSPCTHWAARADELIGRHKLSPPAGARVQALLNEAICCALIACWAEKWRHLRVRPSQLDPGVDVSVIPVPEHPAYPSGHSTVAGAAYRVLKHFFPEERDRLKAMAEESGVARMKAGIHYRSDHTAGLKLGRNVGRAVVRAAARDVE